MRRGVSPSTQDRWLRGQPKPEPKPATIIPYRPRLPDPIEYHSPSQWHISIIRRIGAGLAGCPLGLKGSNRANEILKAAARKYGVTVAETLGEGRHRAKVYARQEAMANISEDCGWSTTKIGIFLGGRDHTTVIHGIKAHKRRIAK